MVTAESFLDRPRGGSRNFIWGPRGAEGAEVEHHRREDRGAAGAEGGEGWEVGVPLSSRGGSGEGPVPLPRNFFKYYIIKWPVSVDSDVLHVLLIVVVKLETCT